MNKQMGCASLDRTNRASDIQGAIVELLSGRCGFFSHQHKEVAIRNSLNLAHLVTQHADAKKAEELVVLDLGGRVSYCDYFVICNGTNRRHVRAIAESILENLKTENGVFPISSEGFEGARWVLLDFGDVVVHVFDESMRGFYDLEGLWADAPRLELEYTGQPSRLHSTAG